jgi:class 3 adenylate cyclase
MLNDLAPDGFVYGGHYVVEFDPDSIWYETSLTITALALKQGIKTEYHVFQHFPREATEALSKLGVDAAKLEKEELLSIWDSFTETLTYETEKKEKLPSELNQWISSADKPLDVVKSAAGWAKRAKAGYSEEDKRWLHIDDNTAIFLQYNDEKDLIDYWRTAALPYGIRARETPHFLAFVKGAASPFFFTKFEALCDGIIDVKVQEEGGRIENYIRIRMLRGKTFDSRWHRIQVMSNGEVKLFSATQLEGKRKLAAIVFTDIVGYTALTQKNERLAMDLLAEHNRILRPIFLEFGGREIKTVGDSFLVEFSSALDAVQCALEIQGKMHNRNLDIQTDRRILLRVGVHVGDVITSGGDILGDAVNISSRVEPLAEPGGVCISGQVYDQVRNKIELPFIKLENAPLKNVSVPVDVYKVVFPWENNLNMPETR